MKRKTEIKQNEMAVTEIVTGKEVLCTAGVSTCICIAAKGQFGTHPFMALFHWDGFAYDFDKQAVGAEDTARAIIELLTVRFVCMIKREFSGYHRVEKPRLTEMHIIGGEKATPDLSGTEFEVEMLRKYLPVYCNKYFDTMPDNRYFFQNYFTGQNGKSDSVTVSITPNGVTIKSDDDALTNLGVTDSESFTSEDSVHDEKLDEPIIRRRKIT